MSIPLSAFPPPIPTSQRCAPGCAGVVIMNTPESRNPEDFRGVDVQRCDSCARFAHDLEAAEYLESLIAYAGTHGL